MSRSRATVALAAAVVAALALALALVGCGIPTDATVRPLAEETTTVPATTPEDGDVTATVYLVPAAPTDTQVSTELVARDRALSGPATPATVMEALLAPPSEAEAADGLLTNIPLNTIVLSDPVVQDGLVSLDLSPEWGELDGTAALPAYAQVVLTLTELSGVEQVRFLVGGDALAAPTQSNGSPPVVSASDYGAFDPDP